MNNDLLPGIIFGPVPSRRLGQSLGINNIPPEYCSYSCIYCQLGSSKQMGTERKNFYDPESVLQLAEQKIEALQMNNHPIDYISFVPDGEPALDVNLGKSIRLLKRTGIKIAVITNSSLLFDEKVREDLMEADWVSLKADTVCGILWKKINRPHKNINLEKIHEGMIMFARDFKGFLATETMLLNGINAEDKDVSDTADFITTLVPRTAYLSIPTRPPAEKSVCPATEEQVINAYRIFSDKGLKTECITGHEGDEFAQTGSITDDILSITSVHPMRDDSMKSFLLKASAGWDIVEQLINDNMLVESEFNGRKFYLRKFDLKNYN